MTQENLEENVTESIEKKIKSQENKESFQLRSNGKASTAEKENIPRPRSRNIEKVLIQH